MRRSATKSTVEKTRSLVREYLNSHDNGRGEAYFKAQDIAEKGDGMTARQVGHGLAVIENNSESSIDVERWGKSRATRWRAFYTQ
jgi:hypothetical protein